MRPICCGKLSRVCSGQTYFSVCFNIPVFTETCKNVKKFLSEIFKYTRSGKPYAEEAPRIEACVNTNIQEK